jgi:hypothetical protein
MEEKQQQLLFDKGITNVPSDAICSDNTLEEALGLVNIDGEHRVIQKPVNSGYHVPSGHTLLFIHKVPTGVHNVISLYNGHVYHGSTDLLTITISGGEYADKVQVNAIGKTLIVLDEAGLHYYLWKEVTSQNTSTWTYVSLPPIPAIDIEFSMFRPNRVIGEDNKPFAVNNSDTLQVDSHMDTGEIAYRRNAGDSIAPVEGKQEDYNNMLVGMYSENKKALASKSGFCLPFLARAALEMYDGSFSHISNPVVLFPTSTQNSYGAYTDADPYGGRLYLNTKGEYLRYKLNNGYGEYSDLVKNVVIFITRGIEIYNTEVDQVELVHGGATVNGIFTGRDVDSPTVPNEAEYNDKWFSYQLTEGQTTKYYNQPLVARTAVEIKNELMKESVFYRLCNVGLSPTLTYVTTRGKFSTSVLLNLETQDQLKVDDYYSNSPLVPSVMTTYNSRLLLANVKRGVFGGYHFFTPYKGSAATHSFLVEIHTDSGILNAVHTVTCNTKQGLYFFYPDRRAKTVIIDNLAYNLTEHEGLNGAYYFAGMPTDAPTLSDSGTDRGNTSIGSEYLQNTIILSEANQPFSFFASGYYTVGMGEINGVATLTKALSQGQFGQFPLIVFSSEGIWAMSVASTGYFSAAHPMSRDVCNNPKSITQTDGAVFFSSAKGLMVVEGAEAIRVSCASEQLSGRNGLHSVLQGSFVEFIEHAKIAYDYRDSLLWIVDKQKDICWIYSIKSGTFAHYYFGENVLVKAVVNAYPDHLLQMGDTVYSLLTRPDANDDTTHYSGRLVSRPMKLENSLALKRLLQVRNIRDVNNDASVILTIKASNVLTNSEDYWVKLDSLRGKPWSFYRFQYEFSDLLATDRFSGAVVATEEVRNNKLRFTPFDRVGAGGITPPVVPDLPDPSTPGELTLYEPLRSMNLMGAPTFANAILVWNGTSWEYQQKPEGGGGSSITIEGATMQEVWTALQNAGDEQINASHLANALNGLFANRYWWGRTFDGSNRTITGELNSVSFIQFTNGVKLGIDASPNQAQPILRIYHDPEAAEQEGEPATEVAAHLYATGGISALGNSPSGGGGGGGAELALPLLEINGIGANPTGGTKKVLVWDPTDGWDYDDYGGGTTPVTYNVFGVNSNGLVPGPQSADTTKFLRADGTWAEPQGGSTPSPISGTYTAWGQNYVNNGALQNVSGHMTGVGNINMDGVISGTQAIELNSDDSNNLKKYGGFIDFHFRDSNGDKKSYDNDFSLRLIEGDGQGGLDGVLTVQTPNPNAGYNVYVPNGIRVGGGRIVWDSAHNSFKLETHDGYAANLYTEGGISALGLSQGGSPSIDELTINETLNFGSNFSIEAEDVPNSQYKRLHFDIVGNNDAITFGAGTMINKSGALFMAEDIFLNTHNLNFDSTCKIFVSSDHLYFQVGSNPAVQIV